VRKAGRSRKVFNHGLLGAHGLEAGIGERPRDGFAERGLRQEAEVRRGDVNEFVICRLEVSLVIMDPRRMGCFGVHQILGKRILIFIGESRCKEIPQISG